VSNQSDWKVTKKKLDAGDYKVQAIPDMAEANA